MTDTVLLIVALLLLWQAASLVLGREVLTSPFVTAAKLGAIVADADFPSHAAETGRAFITALAIALLGGLTLGLALGTHRLSGQVAEPILVALYSIPKITLYPVILLLFGLGISAKIAFGVIHGIIPVTIFTMNGVRNIRGVYFRTARTMRLSPVQTAWTIVIPAAIPEIVSGFRLGFALTLLGTLIGEMFASQRGIGYMLVKAMETNDVATVMALALFLIVLATSASAVLLALDRRLHRRALLDQGH
ncbi:MAG TPA: ABC transporter permease subunit [Microvirga sp.]|nr:ABC transporter permease subunit [Microvirga sp.]